MIAYFGVFAVIGYTDDAYIRSDLVRIAPEVSGPVAAVHVHDNDHVEAGTILLTIDPAPFELAVVAKRDRLANAQSIVALKTESQVSRAASIEAAQAALDLAKSEDQRVGYLTARGFASQQDLDKTRDAVSIGESALAVAKAQAVVAERDVEVAHREVQSAQADLAIAEYNLSRTQLKSAVAGFVNNFDIREGRYVAAGKAMIGLVDDSQWRVIANFKEDVAASVAPGTAVWVLRSIRAYAGDDSGVAHVDVGQLVIGDGHLHWGGFGATRGILADPDEVTAVSTVINAVRQRSSGRERQYGAGQHQSASQALLNRAQYPNDVSLSGALATSVQTQPA
jgi:membrane fusion protein, multidrug efflux system